MSKINKLSIEEIISQIGLAIKTNEYGIILRGNDEAMQKVRRILRRFERDTDYTRDDMQNAIIELLKEYDSIVDKEKLVMLTAYNLKKSLEEAGQAMENKQKKGIKSNLADATKLISDLDARIVFPEYIVGTRFVGRINVLDSKELVQVIKTNKPVKSIFTASTRQKTRYKEATDKIGGIEGVVSLIDFDDIEHTIATDREIGLQISGQITNNVYQKFQADNRTRNILEEAEKNPDRIEKEMTDGGYKNRETVVALEANCKHIDIDKLLLLIGYRIIQDLETDKVEVHYNDGGNALETQREYCMQLLEAVVKNAYNQVAKGTTITGINYENQENFTYSVEELYKDCERFQNGRYYKKAEVESILEDIKAGRMLCKDVPPEVQDLVDFDDETWINIMTQHIDNLIFLIQNGEDKAGAKYYYMGAMDKIPDEVLVALSQKQEIRIDYIISFFEQGKINGIQIKNTGLNTHIPQDIINEKIKELYCEMKESDGEEEQAKSLALFNKYSSLYRILNIEDKSEEEIAESSFALISTFEDELSSRALQELYQQGLITLEVAADWGVDLMGMLEENQIKPSDLKKLYAEDTIKIEQIRHIIIHGTISNDEKQDLIYATFDGDSEEEEMIRNQLIQLLAIGEEYKGEARSTGAKRAGQSKSKWRNFVTDPQTRWKLISLLDKDYSKKILPAGKQVLDGHRVFLLPSHDRIIIEKMYEKKRGEMVSAYGSATYIMGTSEFYDNIDEIVRDGAINRSFLYEMADTEQATPIMHSKNWGKNIMKYFGIDKQNERYTPEEIQEILKAAERVTNSRKERE